MVVDESAETVTALDLTVSTQYHRDAHVLGPAGQSHPTANLLVFRRHPPCTAVISVMLWNLPPVQGDRVCAPVGFANSGGLVFVDESAEHIASA